MEKDIKIGFKAFKKGLIDKFDNKYELNKVYNVDKKIIFGNSGFHICTNLEDTLRYYDSFKEDIIICIVLGFGNFQEHNDEYYGYYDMYSFEHMIIIQKLNRNEIIDFMLKQNEDRIIRFISLYKMYESEFNLFRNISDKIDNYIDYYQLNQKDIFKIKKYSK